MSRDITALPPVPADRRIPYGADPSQFFDVWDAQGSRRGAAVMIHGGFWRARYDLAHASHLCAALARSGLDVASLEYRRVGNGGGWPASFDDVIAGTRAAAHLGSAPVVLGHSAGGHLALRVASEPLGIRGVVALAPAADLLLCYGLHLSHDAVVEFLGATPAERPDLYDAACPSRRASPVAQILLHGTADVVVPIALSRAYLAVRSGDAAKPELIELPGAGHFDLIDPESPAWNVVLESVLHLLA